MKFLIIKPNYIFSNFTFFYLQQKSIFYIFYKYILKNIFYITKYQNLWQYYCQSINYINDILIEKLIKTFLLPYKLFFFKKKKIFLIKILLNKNYLQKKNNFYFFFLIFKILNLKKKIFFFFYLWQIFKKLQLLLFLKILKFWFNNFF